METFNKTISDQRSSKLGWTCLKILFGLTWLMLVTHTCLFYDTGQLEHFTIIPVMYMKYMGIRVFLVLLAFFLFILYVLERKMKFTLVGLSLVSLICFSYEEAMGLHQRTTILTAVFVAQTIAYFLKENLLHNRVQFSVQIVAAIYTLAGISKLRYSGLDWINSGSRIFLQVKKQDYFDYYKTGNALFLTRQDDTISFFQEHPTYLTWLMGIALLIELIAFISLINNKTRIIYGLMLLALHIGIFITLRIIIFPISFTAIIFMLNPLYLIISGISYPFRKRTLLPPDRGKLQNP